MNHWTPPRSDLWTYAGAVPPYWVRKETNGDCMSEHGVHEWRLAAGLVHPGVSVPSAHTCSSRGLNGVLPSSYPAVVRQQRLHWPLMGPFSLFPLNQQKELLWEICLLIYSELIHPSNTTYIHAAVPGQCMYWAAYFERNTLNKMSWCLLYPSIYLYLYTLIK